MWLKYSSQQLLRPSAIAVLVFCLLLLLLRPSVYLPQVPHFFGKIVGLDKKHYFDQVKLRVLTHLIWRVWQLITETALGSRANCHELRLTCTYLRCFCTAKRKLERLKFSTSSSFVKIWSACSCKFKAYFWTFWALYHLLFDLETIGVN